MTALVDAQWTTRKDMASRSEGLWNVMVMNSRTLCLNYLSMYAWCDQIIYRE